MNTKILTAAEEAVFARAQARILYQRWEVEREKRRGMNRVMKGLVSGIKLCETYHRGVVARLRREKISAADLDAISEAYLCLDSVVQCRPVEYSRLQIARDRLAECLAIVRGPESRRRPDPGEINHG